MSFLSELQRRNVFRVGIAYLAGAWLLIQIAETLFPVFELPNSSIRVVVIVLGVGFVLALILAWVFELTPGGRCFYRLGATYIEAFEPESSIPHFEKALLLGAGQLDAAYGIGQAYLMSGDPDAAIKLNITLKEY